MSKMQQPSTSNNFPQKEATALGPHMACSYSNIAISQFDL